MTPPTPGSSPACAHLLRLTRCAWRSEAEMKASPEKVASVLSRGSALHDHQDGGRVSDNASCGQESDRWELPDLSDE
jgi:hypothetical protein